MFMNHIIFVLSILIAGVFNSNFDCDLLTDVDAYSFDEVSSCLSTVPYSSKIARETVDAVLFYYSNYVYGDINIASPPPYSIGVDIVAEMEKIRQTSYQYDYEVHQAIQAEFKKLRDSHTVYAPPICYSTIEFTLPFSVRVAMSNGTQKFFVKKAKNAIIDQYGDVYPESADLPTKYLGWEIVEIAGKDPLEYFLQYIADNKTSYSRDKGVRFNDALENVFDKSVFMSLPPRVGALTFSLRNGAEEDDGALEVEEEVEAKWLGSSQLDISEYRDKGGFLFACGYDYSEENGALESIRKENLWDEILGSENKGLNNVVLIRKELVRRKQAKLLSLRAEAEAEVASGLPGYVTIVETEETSGYYDNSGKIGVMQVKSFMPSDMKKYWSDIVKILKIFHENDINKLIVDVRANGGGIGCLDAYLSIILSKYMPKAMNPPGDMKSSPYWESLYCPANIPKFQYLTDKRKPVEHSNWLKSGPHFTRGGKDSQYSTTIAFDCNLCMEGLAGIKNPKSPIYFEPEDIIILTDGKCGSACGMFVSNFKQQNLAKILTQGGLVDEPLALASFKGASVFNSRDNFPDQVCVTRRCICEEVKVFPGRSIMTFSWYEMYPFNSVTINELELVDKTTVPPVGYTRFPEDARLLDWTFDFEDPAIYELVIPYFDICFDWMIQRNDEKCKGEINHGVYGFPCKDGKWDTSKCVLRGCDEGWYLAEDCSKCKKMPQEFDMWHYFLRWEARMIFMDIVLPLILIIGIPCLFCLFCCLVLCVCACVCSARRTRAKMGNITINEKVAGGARENAVATEKTTLL